MTDTPQPAAAGETEVLSKAESIDAAADAFKVSLGQAPPRERDEGGRFVAKEEIEAPAEAEEAEPVAESPETETLEEAAEEAQPQPIELPVSWPAEKAEIWAELSPEAQGVIAEREGQRDRAVNAKFQDAANVMKANEAIVTEANTNRTRYAEAIDQVLGLVQPQWPSPTMLDYNSGDYNPDEYHLMRAQAEQTQSYIAHLSQQREQLSAQQRDEEQKAVALRFQQINDASRDAFLKNCPDCGDRDKAPAAFKGLMDYAVSQGAPEDIFHTPTTSMEWNVLWKAQQWDKAEAAKARVANGAKPEPRQAQPAVRPGVTTPRVAIQKQKLSGAQERLRQSGSVADGAAVLKHLLG